jgi:hypothetical protein
VAALGSPDHRHRRQPGREYRHGRIGTISRIIAGWPAVALLIAVKLLSGILEYNTSTREAGAPARSDLLAAPVLPAVPPSAASHRPDGASSAARCASLDAQAGGGTVPDGTSALERAARVSMDEVQLEGRPLTRDALAKRLRATPASTRS